MREDATICVYIALDAATTIALDEISNLTTYRLLTDRYWSYILIDQSTLPSASTVRCRLLSAAVRCPLLPLAVHCCRSRSAAAARYPLLPLAVRCCPLSAAVRCRLPLAVPAVCCRLPLAVRCHPLPTAVRCRPLPSATARCRPLGPLTSVARCRPLPAAVRCLLPSAVRWPPRRCPSRCPPLSAAFRCPLALASTACCPLPPAARCRPLSSLPSAPFRSRPARRGLARLGSAGGSMARLCL